MYVFSRVSSGLVSFGPSVVTEIKASKKTKINSALKKKVYVPHVSPLSERNAIFFHCKTIKLHHSEAYFQNSRLHVVENEQQPVLCADCLLQMV